MNELSDKSSETNKSSDAGGDLGAGVAGQVVSPPDGSGGKTGAENGSGVTESGAKTPDESGAAATAPAKKKSAVAKLRDGVWGILGGKSAPDCTCGRKPGVQGRHAKDCAISGAARPKHFAPVDLSKRPASSDSPGDDGEGGAALAERELPAAQKDHSIYRKIAERYFRSRSRFKCLKVEEKFEPLIGEVESEKLARDYGLEKKEIEELGDELKACADAGDWPEVPPLLAFGILAMEIELRWKISDWTNTRRIKKLLEAKKIQDSARREMTQ